MSKHQSKHLVMVRRGRVWDDKAQAHVDQPPVIVDFTLTIDIEAIAAQLAHKVNRSKRGVSKAMAGAVVAKRRAA